MRQGRARADQSPGCCWEVQSSSFHSSCTAQLPCLASSLCPAPHPPPSCPRAWECVAGRALQSWVAASREEGRGVPHSFLRLSIILFHKDAALGGKSSHASRLEGLQGSSFEWWKVRLQHESALTHSPALGVLEELVFAVGNHSQPQRGDVKGRLSRFEGPQSCSGPSWQLWG